MKKISFSKNIIIFIVSLIVGVILVPTTLSIMSEIKNTISKIQRNDKTNCANTNQVKTLDWDIIELPNLFPSFEFKQITNDSGAIIGMKGIKQGITILGEGGKGIEKLTLSFTNPESKDSLKFINYVSGYFFKEFSEADEILPKLLKKNNKTVHIGDSVIYVFIDETTRIKHITIKRN